MDDVVLSFEIILGLTAYFYRNLLLLILDCKPYDIYIRIENSILLMIQKYQSVGIKWFFNLKESIGQKKTAASIRLTGKH